MDFLILPTFPETFDTSSSCTCYMAETHGSDCKKKYFHLCRKVFFKLYCVSLRTRCCTKNHHVKEEHKLWTF